MIAIKTIQILGSNTQAYVNKNGRTMFMLQHPENLPPRVGEAFKQLPVSVLLGFLSFSFGKVAPPVRNKADACLGCVAPVTLSWREDMERTCVLMQ